MPPVVGIVCDRRMIGSHPFHTVGEKYVAAVRDGACALPLLIPSLVPPLAVDEIFAHVDGLLFTGSRSNVAPENYGGTQARDPSAFDVARDATALSLIATAAGRIPMLCICRGFQELNVALGGTLHQYLTEVPGLGDHREHEGDPLDVQYGPAHTICIARGGLLAAIAGMDEYQVNSLHEQGIDRLAPKLQIEAEAPDGAVEAISLREQKAFLLGVQWHPEWKFAENTLSRAIFGAFGQALVKRSKH